MPEVVTQIDGLRAAFSANLHKPFELKPSFPYGTPSEQGKSPEARKSAEPFQQFPISHQTQVYPSTFQSDAYYATPPATARQHPPQQHHDQQMYRNYQNDNVMQQYQQVSNGNNHDSDAITPTEAWNPTPIIDQFDTAFQIPQSALAPPPPSSYSSSPPGALPQQKIHSQIQNTSYGSPAMHNTGYVPSNQYHASPTSQPMVAPQSYMTQSQVPQQQTTQPKLTPSHYPQHHGVNSYFDASIKQNMALPVQQHNQTGQGYGSIPNTYSTTAETGGINAPVYVTAKEWQQSVGGVYDTGMKRKWDYDQHLTMQQQHGHATSGYGRIG